MYLHIYVDKYVHTHIHTDCTDEDSFIVEINYETQPVFPSLSSSLFDKVKHVYISICVCILRMYKYI
jgi:hypothetical protein